MPRWIISFPCWGAHRALAMDGPLDSILTALLEAKVTDAVFCINTDGPEPFRPFLKRCPYEVRFYEVPKDREPGDTPKYNLFGCSHRHAIEEIAAPGDRVALMCGDTTVSVDSFIAANRVFATGKKLILCPGSSTIGRAPITTSSKLLDWTLENLTPMCQSLFWNEGYAAFPYLAYFRHAKGIDLRAFHLHPFAVVKHEGLTFTGPTSDLFLSREFPVEDIHVVKTPHELALAERSEANRKVSSWLFKMGEMGFITWATQMGGEFGARERRWLWHFSNQITLQGEPDPTNQEIADRIIARIEKRWSQDERAAERRKRLQYPWVKAA